MFKKVLIANRGEIAVRIIRACRDLRISPVAVFSEADRTSLHVRLADEAYLLGPAPSNESYLVIDRVIETARKCKADGIHPGYGFLSENARFAQACADAGIPMIGPSAESISLMGSKAVARAALKCIGIPIVPGACGILGSFIEALAEARNIGYPVMLKAAGGGGGKGMRLVPDESHLADDFSAAGSEALRAFGDSSLYLEKYISRPRHIEIQILVDHHGNAVHLGERECSLQRRHQKVVEESPGSTIDPDLRQRMGLAALQVARAAGYWNAGTVEFLLDEKRNFYFLEMNTRLQVEHPVTELVTGTDLVQEQFKIAAGAPLALRQEDVLMRGWALECRIYAEDPDNGFAPSPGVIQGLSEPQGPGVRVDSGIYRGWEVPIHYDPLLAKLVAYGSDRKQAIVRMKRALGEYQIQGIKTNIEMHRRLLADADFVAGNLSTQFLGEFLKRDEIPEPLSPLTAEAMAAATAIAYAEKYHTARTHGAWAERSAWKSAGNCAITRPVREWNRIWARGRS